MRITGGKARGLKLCNPKPGNRSIRPTSDRTREALFSILARRISGSRVLDLYAGTGSLGIEALSRGADAAVFVDQSREALELIHANISHCFPAESRAFPLKLNLARPDALKRLKKSLPQGMLFDLIFLDPPYKKKLAIHSLQMVEKAGIIQDSGLIILEEQKGEHLPGLCGSLECIDQRQYGQTGLWFYGKKNPEYLGKAVNLNSGSKNMLHSDEV